MTLPDIYVPAGSSGHGSFTVDIDPQRAGWAFSGLRVLVLEAGVSQVVETGEAELLVLPLAGGATVEVDGQTFELEGGRFAFPSAIATRGIPVAYYPKSQVRVDLRGAGDCSRQVNNYSLAVEGVTTSHLLACEVITPGGNWSSYPAHKHEQDSEDERELEEIYYFEIEDGPEGSKGFGLHRTYGSPGRPIDLCCEVHDGDVALVPHGYHGPCVAAPGYDMYYLNVMAGPNEDLVWLAPDDPAHHWIRATWENQEVDPRLPMNK